MKYSSKQLLEINETSRDFLDQYSMKYLQKY